MRTPAGLLAITPGNCRDATGGRSLTSEIARGFEGGLRAVSIRERELSDGLLFELVLRVLDVARAFDGGWVGVHDSLHVALAAGAHGVHLGFRSLPVVAARDVCGGKLALGFSAHAGDSPEGPEVCAADYLSFGPVKATPSKQGLVQPTGFDGLREFAGAAARPVLALGGLEPQDAGAVLEAGAAGMAAIRGVFESGDVQRAAASYQLALGQATGMGGVQPR